MHVGEGAAARAGARDLLGAAAVLVEDGALRDDDDVATRELLLELADELGLDAVVLLQQAVRHEDDDGLGASRDVDLLGGRDVKILQVDLDVSGGDLQVEELLGHELFELVGLDAIGLQDLLASGEHGYPKQQHTWTQGKEHKKTRRTNRSKWPNNQAETSLKQKQKNALHSTKNEPAKSG